MTRHTLRGVHVLWILVAFFGVTAAVNAAFIVKAVGTFPGEHTPKSYLQGLDYNNTLERRAAQKQLGWSAAIGFDDAQTPALRVALQTVSGAQVREELDVVARYRIFGETGADRVATMIYLGGGEYAAVVGRLPHGRLEVEVQARRKGGGDIVFEAHKTLATP